MDLKTPSSTKAIFTIRSPLSFFTSPRSKNKGQSSKSPQPQGDPINEPTVKPSYNKNRPKKKSNQIETAPANSSKQDTNNIAAKHTPSAGRRSEDLHTTRFRSSLFLIGKEKAQLGSGFEEKGLEGFIRRSDSNKIKDNRTFSQDVARKISNFFSKFKPVPKENNSPTSDSQSPTAKKQIKRVTFAINIHEAEDSQDDVTPTNVARRRRTTLRNEDGNISPINSKYTPKKPIDSLTIIPVEKRFEVRIPSSKELFSRDPSPNDDAAKGTGTLKNFDLDADFQPYGFTNAPAKSPLTPSTRSSLGSKTNLLTPLNLGNNQVSRTPSDSGSLSPSKDKQGLSPINLLPIKANLMFDNKSRRCSYNNFGDENDDNFDTEIETRHGSMSQRNVRNVVVGSPRGPIFNQRLYEVRNSLKLPALTHLKK